MKDALGSITIETVIAASRTGKVDIAFSGFLIDHQVKSLQTKTARELFAELVVAQDPYLSKWHLNESEVLTESAKH